MKRKGKGSGRPASKETKLTKKGRKKPREKERRRGKRSKEIQEGSPTNNFLVGNYGLRRAERWEDKPSMSSGRRRDLSTLAYVQQNRAVERAKPPPRKRRPIKIPSSSYHVAHYTIMHGSSVVYPHLSTTW